MTEKVNNLRFLSRFKSLKNDSCDHTKINLNDDCLSNFLKIFFEISNQNDVLETKSFIAYLNVLVLLSKDLLTRFHDNDNFIISVYSIVKYSLWNNSRYVRTAGLRCARYYLLNYRHVELFFRMRTDYLLIRSLDLSYDDAINNQYRGNDDAERIQSIRLVYRLSLIAPKIFPATIVNSLVGICLIDVEKNSGPLDLAIRPSIMIMCNLVIINPSISINTRILDALQATIFNADGKQWKLNFRIIEAALLTQLKLVVHSEWRHSLPTGYFNKTLTPFSILSEVHSGKKMESNYNMNYLDVQSDFESTSIDVLCTIFRSWSGLLYFSSSNNKPVLSITGLLAVGCSEMRDRILDLLFQIFNIYRPPLDCEDFSSCLRAVNNQRSAKYRRNWSLEEDFLIAQCNDCLPYISSSRINILDNYEVILLGVFVHNNLFEALAKGVADDKESTSARAGLLLAYISYKVSILFPSDHCLSRRSDKTKLLDNPKSNRALLWIDQVHKNLEQFQFEITPFMTYIIQQQPNHMDEGYFLSKRYIQPSNIDEILDSSCLIASSLVSKKSNTISKMSGNNRLSALLDQVFMHSKLFDDISLDNNKTYYDQWNWDLLLVFARTLADSKLQMNFDKELLNKVLKTLMNFFIPQINDTNDSNSCQTFASLPLTWKNSSKAAFVITDIVGFFIEYFKSFEMQDDLNLFLSTMKSYMCGCLYSATCQEKHEEIKDQYGDMISSTESLFTEYDLNIKCSSYLFLAVGRMSATDIGEAFLEKSGIVEIFKTLLDYSRSDIYIKLILGSLDYTRPSLGRSLLSIAVTSNNLLTRRYSVQFLRVLLRAKVPFFANWAVNLLLKQIHDPDVTVRKICFDILQEASEDESVINNFSIDSMTVLQLGYDGFMLSSRMLSLPFHFEKLDNRKSIDTILDMWHEKNYDLEYCKRLDEQLMQHFTNYEAPIFNPDDPDGGRLSNKTKIIAKELILPCHPYSCLSAHRDGLDLLINRGFLEDCAEIISKEQKSLFNENNEAVMSDGFVYKDHYELHLRSKMLACCHITTSVYGLECAINMNLPTFISDITKFHPSLNVRGTGIICLGLIGSTPRGANILINLQWMALRSDRLNKWPLLLDVYHNLYQSREEVKRQLYAGKKPFSAKNSSFLLPSSIDGSSDPKDNWTSVGYSVFAMPLYSKDAGERSRKVTYELIEDVQNEEEYSTKSYATSVDDSIIKSKTGTINSNSSANIFTEEEKQIKFNKLVNHRREQSLGASSMFNVPTCETEASMSPHDVLGIATMRRIQKKSRTTLFQSNVPFTRLSFEYPQIDHCSHSLGSAPMDLFSNSRRTSVINKSINKRRKKFSSLITPKSNLNKYRGVVMPINFSDLSVNIFPQMNDKSHKVSSSNSHMVNSLSMLSDIDFEFEDVTMKTSSMLDKSLKQSMCNKMSDNSGNRSVYKDDTTILCTTVGTSGYISLEESSCVLDLALLAVDDSIETNKIQRSGSDEPHKTNYVSISLRPRAITTPDCRDCKKYSLYSENCYDNQNTSIPFIVVNTRDNLFFVGGNIPKIHEVQMGLTYHHEDCCLHLGCCITKGETVSESVVDFRKEILQAVNSIIVLSPRTKKMEMILAKLKVKKIEHLWSDLCLYSEICILFSIYSYSKQSRLYIQDLFISVPMPKLVDDMKSCLQTLAQHLGCKCSQFTRL